MSGFEFLTIIIGFVFVVVVIYLAKGLVIVQQSESMVIERLGEYSRTLEQGLHLLIPFVDNARLFEVREKRGLEDGSVVVVPRMTKRIDRREQVLDLASVPVITRDNVTVSVDTAIYLQIIQPKDAVLSVANLFQAVETLAQTTLRSKVGEMELDKLLESRSEINSALTLVMDEVGNKWGCKVNRAEVQGIAVPHDVEESMRKQMAAERQRRATVTAAEGEKQAAIARAEGDKQAAVLRAQGQREAIRTLMDATKNSDSVNEKDIISYLLALDYIQTLPTIAKDGERVFLPYEATALLGSVGGIKDLFTVMSAPKG